MTDNPFKIVGPALISFSGGRTSAFMLRQILDAHGGALPDDVKVAFANTGKEREETLRFVHECGSRWSVRIHWLEWRNAKPCFEEVGFNSASRDGEPFAALIAKKQRLPNWQERWCTEFLKVRVLTEFARAFGWRSGGYAEVIGLRHDEGSRVLRSLHNANFRTVKGAEVARTPARKVIFPLASAKVTKTDVMAFWAAQPFNLDLRPWESNCDLCFMKSKAIKLATLRDNPALGSWWEAEESRGQFDRRHSIADLVATLRAQPDLFAVDPDEEYDVECGVSCAGESE